jgi:hypothetical protein
MLNFDNNPEDSHHLNNKILFHLPCEAEIVAVNKCLAVNAHSLYADVTFHAKQSLALDWCG